MDDRKRLLRDVGWLAKWGKRGILVYFGCFGVSVLLVAALVFAVLFGGC